MRRQDRQRDRDFALRVVDQCEYMVLSMVTTDHTPYGVAVTPVRIGENLYFHCATEGKKTDILRQNRIVSVLCVGETQRLADKFTTKYESAIITGSADEVTDSEEKIIALRALCQRHTPTNMAAFDIAIEKSLSRTAVWRISINEITGKQKA